MKNRTIWQRLNTALLVLIVLLLAGVGLEVWCEKAGSEAERCSGQLSSAKDHIYLAAMRISEALRGLAAEPKSEPEKRRQREAARDAEAGLKNGLDDLQKTFSDYPELVTSARKLREFALGSSGMLNGFHRRVQEMAEAEPIGALAYYDQNFPGVRDQRDQLFKELTAQVEQAQAKESSRAQTISVVSSACIVAVLIACVAVGF